MTDFTTDQIHVKATERMAYAHIDPRGVMWGGSWEYAPRYRLDKAVVTMGQLAAEAWRWPSDFNSIHRVPE